MHPLTDNLATFGRHETFSLRYSWLTKGFCSVQKNSNIFSDDNATIELGVGKNMVHAIKYWLRASDMIEEVKGKISVTSLGELLLDENGADPFLEDEATLWLIHWQIATNAHLATAWFWFFNCFHKAEFSSDEAKKALSNFIVEHFKDKHYSIKTVQQEVVLLLRMYAPLKLVAGNSLDEILDAPLANLNLITYSDVNHLYCSAPQIRTNLPIEIIGFAITEIFNNRNVVEMPLEELVCSKNQMVSVGAVFRLTENDLVAKLELLVEKYHTLYQIREKAGNRQLHKLKEIQSSEFLKDYYEHAHKMD